jgi:hypothetical protein
VQHITENTLPSLSLGLKKKIGYVSAEYEEMFHENISTSEKYYWRK